MDTVLSAMGQSAVANGGLVDKFFLSMTAKAHAAGIELAGVNDFLKGQLSGAAGGFNDILKGLQDSATAVEKSKAKIRGPLIGESDEEFKKRFDEVVGRVELTKTQFDGLSAGVSADFFEMIAKGVSFQDALKAVQPSIDLLQKSMRDMGYDAGGAFQSLINMSDIANDAITGPLLSSISGVDQALKGMHNSGLLDQGMFDALASVATDSYNKIIAQGKDGDAALRAIQPTLQDIWRLQQDFGLKVDDATQALLDQAEASGIVGDKQRSIAEKTLLAIERVANAVERAFGLMPSQAASAATGIERELGSIKIPPVKIPVEYPQLPGGPFEDYPGFASEAFVRHPTMALLAETGPEFVLKPSTVTSWMTAAYGAGAMSQARTATGGSSEPWPAGPVLTSSTDGVTREELAASIDRIAQAFERRVIRVEAHFDLDGEVAERKLTARQDGRFVKDGAARERRRNALGL
jgi:hypothetical protein